MNLERSVGKVVRVHWRDAVGSSEWRSEEDAKRLQLAECADVGEILLVDDERVVMCASRDDNGNVNGTSVIPRGWVRRVERLR